MVEKPFFPRNKNEMFQIQKYELMYKIKKYLKCDTYNFFFVLYNNITVNFDFLPDLKFIVLASF